MAAAAATTTTDPSLLGTNASLNSSDAAAESMWRHQQEKSSNMRMKGKYPARQSSQEDGLQQQGSCFFYPLMHRIYIYTVRYKR